jgi:hypothetical protein
LPDEWCLESDFRAAGQVRFRTAVLFHSKEPARLQAEARVYSPFGIYISSRNAMMA